MGCVGSAKAFYGGEDRLLDLVDGLDQLGDVQPEN